jgi:hypothetical protein
VSVRALPLLGNARGKQVELLTAGCHCSIERNRPHSYQTARLF